MPEHQDAVQLRAARHRRRGPCLGAAIVRKLSGFNKPSHANEDAFNLAVEEVSAAAHKLLASLHTHAPPRDREVEAEKAKERARVGSGRRSSPHTDPPSR